MISYFKLWRLLEKRGYQRKDIVRLAGISESTYRKLLSSEAVRMDVLQRICVALNVDVGDICVSGCNSSLRCRMLKTSFRPNHSSFR